MSNEIDKVIEGLKKVSLSSEEKSFIKQRISSHMDMGLVPSYAWYKKESFFNWFTLNPLYAVPLVLFLIITAGGSTGIVAQKALPDDSMYSLKIQVNENVQPMSAVSPAADSEVTLMQAARQFEAVEDLSVEGNMPEARVMKIKDNSSEKVSSPNRNLIKIEKQSNSKISSEISNKLKKQITEHYKVFLEVSKNSTTTSPFFEILKSRIEDKIRAEESNDRFTDNEDRVQIDIKFGR